MVWTRPDPLHTIWRKTNQDMRFTRTTKAKGIEGTLERIHSLRDTNLDIETVHEFMTCDF